MPLSGQEATISRYDRESSQRLLDREITDIVRDRQGFLWIGSEDGLTRFDGERFDQFKKTYPKGQRISGMNVERILTRPDGKLVLQYSYDDRVLDIFDPVSFQNTPVSPSIDGQIADVAPDPDQEDVVVLVSLPGETGVCSLVSGDSLRGRYFLDHGDFSALSIYPAQQSDWIVFDNGEIIEYDKQGTRKRSLIAPSLNGLNYSRERYVEFIHELDGGDCVFSFEAVPGLFMLRQGSVKLSEIRDIIPQEYWTHVWKDTAGNRLLYAGSSFRPVKKLFFWHDQARKFQDVSSWLTSKNQVTSIYGENFYEGFAIGYTNGFDVMYLLSDKFKRYLMQEAAPGEWGTVVRGICQDEERNTYVAREINNWFRIFVNGKVDTLQIFKPENPFEYNFKCARNLLKVGTDLIGSAHFGDNTYGIFQYDASADLTRVLPVPNHVQHMVRIRDSVWIACGEEEGKGDVYTLNLKTRELKPFRDKNGKDPFDADLLLTIEEVRPGLLWIGCREGLYQIDVKSREVSYFNSSSPEPYDFFDTWIMDIHRHSNGEIYIGYRSAGFEVIDLKGGTSKHYTVQEGLANDNVALFVEDTTGAVWIGTFGGLSKFDPAGENFVNFFEADGLPHNEFNRYSKLSAGNEIWMGTVNGVMSFNPYELMEESHPPRILLTQVKYFDESGAAATYHGPFEQPIPLSIPAENRSLEVSFHLDNFLTSRQDQYEYRIGQAADSEWQTLGSEGELILNYLPVGRYPVSIRGLDKYGNLSSNEIRLDLNVHQFLYESAWFYVLISLVLLGLFFMIIRGWFQQKFRLFQVRQDISRDLHDEVGSLLTGLAMKTDLLAMKVPSELKGETKKLGTMGRDAVRLMRDIVWSIDASKNTMQDLMDRIREFASEVFSESGISYEVRPVNCDPAMKLDAGVRKNVYLIVREAINNTLKHAQASHVIIRMIRDGGQCRVTVEDNGIGMAANLKSSGLGLKNMRERAQHIGGKLSLSGEEGVRVMLTFPV